ncbi:alpha-L-rhamnosidase [Chitinophaga costaii]|uniref:alpha-L-rhamnosidase n=1 Tax=Chitinophaga costaii TaxID=1335309 RepID=A0A1C4G5A8_9BACT|nr:alpha-L-rhamnosidase [Chitinophaga costaii]PUZ19689.1 alpha-L-rhamnosidase [Chitinophaga costaii]SCC63378.1 alpha-L-rhamnosidase [Chitinophaga costaii]
MLLRFYFTSCLFLAVCSLVGSKVVGQELLFTHASWINPGYAENQNRRACPVFMKDFESSQRIASATVSISAHGLYEAYLNDKRVGDAWFTPGFTNYDSRIQYQQYDIKKLLKKGKNHIQVTIGEGWYRGAFGNRQTKNLYGKDAGLIFQLDITYVDGSHAEIVSDTSWRSGSGPIVYADIYNGETDDARIQTINWTGVVVGNYSKEVLIPTVAPPVKIHASIAPVKVLNTPLGEQVIDFGQNLAGWVRFKVKGHAGDTITLEHAEMLDKSGNLYTKNLRAAQATDRYILKDDHATVFAPHFTWHGFRYVKVKGCVVKPEDFRAEALYSDIQPAGSFSCSNPLLNQLQHNIIWSLRSNFLDVPTDCPQRSERLGWTADAQVFFRTAAFNYNIKSFFEKWMEDMAVAQGADGSMPLVVPDVYAQAHVRPPRIVAGWGDAATILPWQHFLVYNDTAVLQRHYPGMKAWVDHIRSKSHDTLWTSGGFGDWMAPADSTSLPFIDQCYWAYSIQLVILAARTLGNTADIAYYEDQLSQIKKAFLAHYIGEDGKVTIAPTQTAYVLALQFNMLPDSLQPTAAAELAALVAARNNHLATGFLGTPYLLFALSDHGYSDLAFTLLNQDTSPSWLYPVKMGATTIWEKWDAQRPDSTLQEVSFNHYAYGAVGDWLYREVAGIDLTQPGYRQLVIRPHPGGGLTWVKARYPSTYGDIVSNWTLNGKEIKMHVVIPKGIQATVYVPGKSTVSVNTGTYDFTGTIE